MRGVLVKTTVYAPVDPNLKGVRTVKGDYHEGQLAHRMDTPQLVGDLGEHYAKFGQGRKAIVFAVNVAHSMHICAELIRRGFRAEHLDGGTPLDDRNAILARLKSGETQLITNCMVLTEGFDCPDISCCILARPTKKMGLYRQMIGRTLRACDGKTNAVVLDHSGAVHKHELADDHVDWFLDPDKSATSSVHQGRKGCGENGGLLECAQCSALRLGGQPCPECGFLPKRPPKSIDFLDGELGLYTTGSVQANAYDAAARRDWHAQLLSICQQREYKPGWAAYKYKEKFGQWPNGSPAPTPPSAEVLGWVRSRNIAWAKSKNNPSGVAT